MSDTPTIETIDARLTIVENMIDDLIQGLSSCGQFNIHDHLDKLHAIADKMASERQ